MRFEKQLLLINIMALMLIASITFFPSNFLRIILGLPFVLFFPGYVLTSALFPKRSTLDTIQKIAFSLGTSIVITPFIGFILNYSPWGVKLYPLLVSITVFIFIISIVCWYRQSRLAVTERITFSLNLSLSVWWRRSIVEKSLAIIVIAAILGAIGIVAYVSITPTMGDRFTEFYVLGTDGTALAYPVELKVEEESQLTIGIINREYDTISYWLEIRIGDVRNNRIGPLELTHEEKWEDAVSFTPDRVGEEQKLELLLYKNEESESYLELRLWIDVD